MNAQIAYKSEINFTSSTGKGRLSIYFFNIFYGKYSKKIILWQKFKAQKIYCSLSMLHQRKKIKYCHKTSLQILKGSHIRVNQFLQFFPDWLPLTYVGNASPQICIGNEAGAIYIKNDADVDDM